MCNLVLEEKLTFLYISIFVYLLIARIIYNMYFYFCCVSPKNLQITNKLENKVKVHNQFYSLIMLDFQKQKNNTKIIEKKVDYMFISNNDHIRKKNHLYKNMFYKFHLGISKMLLLTQLLKFSLSKNLAACCLNGCD